MNEIPCKNCISYAICNSKFNNTTKSHAINIVKKMIYTCCYIRRYVYSYNTEVKPLKSMLLSHDIIKLDIGCVLKFFTNRDEEIEYIMWIGKMPKYLKELS